MKRAILIAAAAALAAAAPAQAHVQVRPALVAPGDPVLFEVIVPGERDAHTTQVTLQVPKDVLPFSYEDPPGWKRTLDEGADGSIQTIVWTGELAEDGFARFAFLASTPEREGALVWKALQRYDDGTIARWIGAPDSDNPAPVTTVSKSAPRENAGGEGAQASATATPARAAATADDDDGPLPLVVALVALALALTALVIALRPSRRAGPAGG